MNGMFLLWSLVAVSAGNNMEFNDYAKALEAAREQNRLLIVVLYQGSRVNTATPVGQSAVRLRNHFVLCRVNVETPYGSRVAQAFRRDRFPHVAVIDANRMLILQRYEGALDQQVARQLLVRWTRATASASSAASAPSGHRRTYSRSRVFCFS